MFGASSVRREDSHSGLCQCSLRLVILIFVHTIPDAVVARLPLAVILTYRL